MVDGLTVLVADDDRAIRELYGHWLGDQSLRLAADGWEAVEQFDAAVDVAYLDREMPGPSGARPAAELTTETRKPHVALVSSLPADLDLSTVPVDQYVRKPVDRATVRGVLDAYEQKRAYLAALEEYFSLTAKLAAVEAGATRAELAEDDRYAALRERVAEKRAAVDEAIRGPETDWTAAFSSLSPPEHGFDRDRDDGDPEPAPERSTV
jgi:CheY-like chemotaxis protein